MSTQSEASTQLRYAMIGGGAGIAATHLRALLQMPEAKVVGVSDISSERGSARATEANCPFFLDHRAMLAETAPDVAVITTPHPFHADLALDCFAAGVHVLVEKPLAVEVAEADRMIAAADAAGLILAVNFQQRFRPVVEHARGLVESGAIGPLVRVLSVEPWYRTSAYYRAATWRGTWEGEGGGVLLNQSPHTLDLLSHLAGLPARVWGWTRTRYHAIECEDTAQAMLQYPNGAPGYFSASTAETGLERRMEIVGENGALELVGDRLTIHRFVPSMVEHMATSTELYRGPADEVETVNLPGDGGGHLAVYRDLHRAITEGGKPRCDGREGRMSLELANAITLSSYTDRPIDLPVDRAAYAHLIADLKARHPRATA
jgi:UDP-N-acetyl-2-amino-2-deoxyglucuronate dehydrogenase